MNQDQLTRAERIRLECFAQAVSMTNVVPPIAGGIQPNNPREAVIAAEQCVFRRAEEIEKWLRKAGLNDN